MKNSSGIELFVLVVLIMVFLAYCNSQYGVNIVSHVYTGVFLKKSIGKLSLWGRIYVKCPHCGKEQKYDDEPKPGDSRNCMDCGKAFKIMGGV